MLAQTVDFPGWDGFLNTRASLMMDFVVVAMVAVLGVLFWSVRQVKRGRYQLHRRVQIGLTVVLLAAVTAFEVDVRVNGWRERAAGAVDGSPEFSVWALLSVHLFFAVTTFVLWPVVAALAVRRFPNPPVPGEYSATHMRWARLAAWDLAATTVTGWLFYYFAFVR